MLYSSASPRNMPIAGLGPHGERAVPPSLLKLSEENTARAREARFTVAIVLHTTTSDWAKQQLAGLMATFGHCAAVVIEVVDCNFDTTTQIEALNRLVAERPDAIISIPIGNKAVAEAHRQVRKAGIKLILIDNAPTGLLLGQDYVTVISADNFGLGQLGAELLSPHVQQGETIGLLSYGVDFFATNQRDIAFRKWMEAKRPDLIVKQAKFPDVKSAAAVTEQFVESNPELKGMFIVWDEPAMQAVEALRQKSRSIPVTTIDLGNDVAIELAGGGLIKGIGAQQPYTLGTSLANATILSLLGRELPPWIALPGLAVTQKNVVESYQTIWHSPAPAKLIKAWRKSNHQDRSKHPEKKT